ncbi:glycosyltransferase [Planotetraspora sp. GP83]|uniref:glycosyltransferase n=1 Tax=Planotetraspora sp. GP83 TaxID=3156264 RepID=UPI00351481A2
MKLLVLPRDGNPYQELLYTPMRSSGVRVRYLGRLTPSHTLNLLLLPAELAVRRLSGARLLHLHWVFAFAFPGGPVMRHPARLWFGVVLRVVRLLSIRLIWTAHNVLPHTPVFGDDAEARRLLVRHCDLVIAHSPVALRRLEALGARSRRSMVVPHGPYPAHPIPPAGSSAGPRRFLFFGRVEEYKGVEDLITAFAALPDDMDVRLAIVGSCGDERLAARLRLRARDMAGRVELQLARVPDEDLPGVFAAADAVVLPFRRVTTSGSAILALCYGRPLIVPDADVLSGLPADAAIRYDGGVTGLTNALIGLASSDSGTLRTMSDAALAHVRQTGWEEIAETTWAAFAALLDEAPDRDPPASEDVSSSRLSQVRARVRSVVHDRLYRSSLLLLANTAFLAGFGFVFWTLAARSYAAEAVGWLAGVTAAVNLLATVAALGLPNTLIRHLARDRNPRALVGAAVALISAVGGVLTVCCVLAIGPLLPPTLHLDQRGGGVSLVTILVAFTAVSSAFDAGLIAAGATGALLVKNLAGSIAKVLALIALTRFEVTGLVMAYGVGTALGSILGGLALVRRLGRGGRPRHRVPTLRRYVSYAAGTYLGTIMGILPSTVVPLETLAIRGPQETAWFAIAFQLAAFLNFIPSTTSQALFAESSGRSLRQGVWKALKGIYALLLPAVFLMVLAAPYLLRLFGETYSTRASDCLRVLALGALVTAGNYVMDTALIARDRASAYVLVNGANAALVLTLVAVLMPFGLTAAAWGWVLAQAVSLVVGFSVVVAAFRNTSTPRAKTA